MLTDALDQFEANGQQGYTLDTRLRLAEVAAHAGDADGMDLNDLPEDLPSTLEPIRKRLVAWSTRDVEALREIAAKASPYDRALCLDLVARLSDDQAAADEAASILATMGAGDAPRYALP